MVRAARSVLASVLPLFQRPYYIKADPSSHLQSFDEQVGKCCEVIWASYKQAIEFRCISNWEVNA